MGTQRSHCAIVELIWAGERKDSATTSPIPLRIEFRLYLLESIINIVRHRAGHNSCAQEKSLADVSLKEDLHC